ncbi:MAG: ribonuclease H-like YkuK family protein [Bacteroidia bacterium]
MVFRILSTDTRVFLNEYIRDYLQKNPKAQIIIGCDSKNRDDETVYGLVVVLYKNKKGGHVLYGKERVPRVRDRWSRLWKEVEYSVDMANQLVQSGLPKATFIDLDLNPDPQFKSNDVVRAAVGLVESMGYQARTKPYSLCASYAADKVC